MVRPTKICVSSKMQQPVTSLSEWTVKEPVVNNIKANIT
jgi:hypothetical protein